MGSFRPQHLGHRRVLRARGGTAAMMEAAVAAADEAEARFAGAFSKLEKYTGRHREQNRLETCRAEWAAQLDALRAGEKRAAAGCAGAAGDGVSDATALRDRPARTLFAPPPASEFPARGRGVVPRTLRLAAAALSFGRSSSRPRRCPSDAPARGRGVAATVPRSLQLAALSLGVSSSRPRRVPRTLQLAAASSPR